MEEFETDPNKKKKEEIKKFLKFLFDKGEAVKVVKHKKKIHRNRFLIFIDGKLNKIK